MAVTVTLHALEGADDQQRSIVERGCALLQQAVNDPRFAERVKNATYKESRFKKSDGTIVVVEPGKVLDYVLGGLERDTGKDDEIDLSITLAHLRAPTRLRAGTVGATITGKLPITTAYWFIDGCVKDGDAVSPARHFLHEWMHVAGFIHYPDNSARDDVPYVLGEIVRAVLTESGGEQLVETRESAEMRRLLDEADEEVHLG